MFYFCRKQNNNIYMDRFTIKCKMVALSEECIPKMQREGDACFDCYSRIENPVVIYPGERTLIPLGFKIQLDDYTEAIIRPRSGLTSKGIDVSIGTVDSNYRGEVKACVINNSREVFTIAPYDRICQMAIRKYDRVEFTLVDKLDNSNRGESGFGSTGIK